MRIIFMGTPDFAKVVLEKLIKEKYQIVAVVTQPDKVVGRKKEVSFSPVKELAIKHELKLFQPEKIRNDYAQLLDLKADLIITAAYGQILPKELLNQIKAINVHGSLLPKYRGGAPIQYALFDGLDKTGITVMEMAYQMDSGDIILQEEVVIEASDNYTSLAKKMADVGANLLIKVLKGDYPATKQDESKVTFAYTLKRNDEFLDFSKTGEEVINHLRGLLEEPGGSVKINGVIYKIYNLRNSGIINGVNTGVVVLENKRFFINTKTTLLEVLEIQAPGKKRLLVKDFLNGQKLIKDGDIVERKD